MKNNDLDDQKNSGYPQNQEDPKNIEDTKYQDDPKKEKDLKNEDDLRKDDEFAGAARRAGPDSMLILCQFVCEFVSLR